jgi:ferredoxin
MKVNVDRDLCALNAECVAAAPGVFRLEGGDLVYEAEPGDAEHAEVELAVRACPMQAISLGD